FGYFGAARLGTGRAARLLRSGALGRSVAQVRLRLAGLSRIVSEAPRRCYGWFFLPFAKRKQHPAPARCCFLFARSYEPPSRLRAVRSGALFFPAPLAGKNLSGTNPCKCRFAPRPRGAGIVPR